MPMNLNDQNQPDPFGIPKTREQLIEQLLAMEKAGASLLDRMRVSAEFFRAKKKNAVANTAASDPCLDDEGVTSNHHPHTCAHDATGSAQHARTSAQDARSNEPTTGPNAGGCDPQADHSTPPPEPPPKFQFGPEDDLYEAAVDFQTYRDKRSVLDNLPDDERAAIFKLLRDYAPSKVSGLLAQHPPAGLGIHVSRRSLQRFEERYRKEEQARAARDFQLQCEELLEAAKTNDQAFLHASERLLKMRLFQITGDPESNLETIAKLASVITSLRKQSLAERKLEAKGKE